MKIPVMSRAGTPLGREIELPDSIFAIEPHEHVLWLAAKVYQSNLRQGTHAHKNRALVSGGGKKPFRQKGTGRARQGTIRAPQMRGGGRVFGPVPHSYRLRLPLKVKRLAKVSALSAKVKLDSLFVVEDFTLEQVKTKEIATFFNALLASKNTNGKSILLLTSKYEPNLLRAVRNIPFARIKEATIANAYDILRSRYLVLQESAIPKLTEVLKRD
ncbi:MAG: 50S ribosomal protein L4 [bacterium]|nr:50S ribosomal protein L4 [bacterium]